MSSEKHRPSAHVLHLCIASLLVTTLAACGKDEKIDPELSRKLIEPVARFELKREAPAAAGNRTGEQVYQAVCTGCHGAGVAGAPKTGEAGDWQPRIAKGFETLVKNAINGIGAMPPRGGGNDLTDEEVARATAYLANQAGANFTAPEPSAGGSGGGSAPASAPAAATPAETAPAGEAPAGGVPAGDAPAAGAPSEGAPAESAPAGEAPAGR